MVSPNFPLHCRFRMATTTGDSSFPNQNQPPKTPSARRTHLAECSAKCPGQNLPQPGAEKIDRTRESVNISENISSTSYISNILLIKSSLNPGVGERNMEKHDVRKKNRQRKHFPPPTSSCSGPLSARWTLRCEACPELTQSLWTSFMKQENGAQTEQHD